MMQRKEIITALKGNIDGILMSKNHSLSCNETSEFVFTNYAIHLAVSFATRTFERKSPQLSGLRIKADFIPTLSLIQFHYILKSTSYIK